MKSVLKAFWIGALVAVIGFSFASCDLDGTGGGGTGTAPAITTASLPNGTAGTAYSQTLTATGGTPITWSLESGALPTGLNLLGSGAISGTPTTAATSAFTVRATNSAGSSTKQLSITVTGGGTPNLSLNGVWERSGFRITVSGSTGVWNAFGSFSALWQNAADKNLIKLGDQVWRNITSTGNLTWSGQEAIVGYYSSNPNVATDISWATRTFTMSADGQTLTVGNNTWTRVSTYSIDGIWERSGFKITVSGNTGVWSAFGSFSALWQNAADKNLIKLGDQVWRNIASTGNLTWSGQEAIVGYYSSNPNVATDISWATRTFTMSADGQTLTVGNNTWTRQ